jgi:hypothetical protein
VARKVGDIGLGDHTRMDIIAAHTIAFMTDPEIASKKTASVQILIIEHRFTREFPSYTSQLTIRTDEHDENSIDDEIESLTKSIAADPRNHRPQMRLIEFVFENPRSEPGNLGVVLPDRATSRRMEVTFAACESIYKQKEGRVSGQVFRKGIK